MVMTKLSALFVMVAVAVASPACTKREETPPAPAAAPSAPAAPAAAAAAPATGNGIIKGVVKLQGTPPEAKLIKRDTDPYCARQQMKEEEVIVGPGGVLKNVLVRITRGLTGSYDPPAASAMLNQDQCMYRPRVQAIMAGQSLLIKNGDQTQHNIHSYKGASTIFNMAQIPGQGAMEKKFTDAGDIIKFKCDVHPWMTGYVGIVNHPFFVVTGDDGAFSIGKVPPGTYTVEAWHERYGSKSSEITVAGDKPTELSFTFDAK